MDSGSLVRLSSVCALFFRKLRSSTNWLAKWLRPISHRPLIRICNSRNYEDTCGGCGDRPTRYQGEPNAEGDGRRSGDGRTEWSYRK